MMEEFNGANCQQQGSEESAHDERIARYAVSDVSWLLKVKAPEGSSSSCFYTPSSVFGPGSSAGRFYSFYCPPVEKTGVVSVRVHTDPQCSGAAELGTKYFTPYTTCFRKTHYFDVTDSLEAANFVRFNGCVTERDEIPGGYEIFDVASRLRLGRWQWLATVALTTGLALRRTAR